MTDETPATTRAPSENGLKGRPAPIELPKVPEHGAFREEKPSLATPQFSATPTLGRAQSQTPRTPRTPSLRRSATFVDVGALIHFLFPYFVYNSQQKDLQPFSTFTDARGLIVSPLLCSKAQTRRLGCHFSVVCQSVDGVEMRIASVILKSD